MEVAKKQNIYLRCPTTLPNGTRWARLRGVEEEMDCLAPPDLYQLPHVVALIAAGFSARRLRQGGLDMNRFRHALCLSIIAFVLSGAAYAADKDGSYIIQPVLSEIDQKRTILSHRPFALSFTKGDHGTSEIDATKTDAT